MSARRCSSRAHALELGFSLVEIVVAMLILALMTLGALPLMLRSVHATTENRSLVIATTYANAQLSELRASFANDNPRSCAELIDPTKAYLATGIPGPDDSGLLADRTAPATPCGGPAFDTVTVTVTVYPADNPGRTLVTLTSEVLVKNP